MTTPRDEPFSHLAGGEARMVDVGGKRPTRREAVAEAWVEVGPAIARRLHERGGLAKGNVLETARLAGIQAAKKTADLIPLCHNVPLDAVEMEARLEGDRVHLTARVRCHARTGVEMEALTAVAVAALTVYDMVKSARDLPGGGRGVRIREIRLLEKRGGRSGRWTAPAPDGEEPSGGQAPA